MKENIYREWYEVESEDEAREKWKELVSRGYYRSEICIARYQGSDGKCHRQVFVFA